MDETQFRINVDTNLREAWSELYSIKSDTSALRQNSIQLNRILEDILNEVKHLRSAVETSNRK